MKPFRKRKIVIIGLGFLMEYIFPCFKKIYGDESKNMIIGVTADEADLEGKKQRMGIDVVLNDNMAALKTMQPDMIFFAPPPQVARSITEDVLVPYYEELARAGKTLPQLLAFPPSPAGSYYQEKLGANIIVANIIPNMISKVGDEDVLNEGCHLITFPARDNWSEEERQELFRFFLPLGRSLSLTPAIFLPVLSAMIATHPLTELADIAARVFNAQGIVCNYGQIASVMRAHHQIRQGYRAPNSNNCNFNDIPDSAVQKSLTAVLDTWYDSLYQFLIENNFSVENSKAMLNALFDLYLHEAQVEDRETIVHKAKKDATKGGMLELCMVSYYAVLEPLLQNYFSGNTDILSEIGLIINEITNAVVERGRGLADSASGAFTPYQHAVMFALFSKNILDVFGEEEGDRLLLSAVAQYGEERGRRMAKRCVAHNKPLNMDGFLAFAEWRYAKDFEKTALFDKPYRAYRILRCPWVSSWEQSGLREYGKYYCRVVDVAILRGFNPDLSFEMPSYLTQEGGEYCEFHWKDLIVDEAQIARTKAIVDEIGESCVKDFIFHTAHLFGTLENCVSQLDSAKGAKAAMQAREAFIKKCSYQEWLWVLALKNIDFNEI